jgi:hypothetical protein
VQIGKDKIPVISKNYNMVSQSLMTETTSPKLKFSIEKPTYTFDANTGSVKIGSESDTASLIIAGTKYKYIYAIPKQRSGVVRKGFTPSEFISISKPSSSLTTENIRLKQLTILDSRGDYVSTITEKNNPMGKIGNALSSPSVKGKNYLNEDLSITQQKKYSKYLLTPQSKPVNKLSPSLQKLVSEEKLFEGMNFKKMSIVGSDKNTLVNIQKSNAYLDLVNIAPSSAVDVTGFMGVKSRVIPFSGTKSFLGSKSFTSTSSKQFNVGAVKTFSAVRNINTSSLKEFSATKTFNVVSSKQFNVSSVREVSASKQFNAQYSSQVNTQVNANVNTNVNVNAGFGGVPNIPITKIPRTEVRPDWFELGKSKKRKKKNVRVRASFKGKYNPSLVAEVFNIRSKNKPSKFSVSTGLSIRPIVFNK